MDFSSGRKVVCLKGLKVSPIYLASSPSTCNECLRLKNTSTIVLCYVSLPFGRCGDLLVRPTSFVPLLLPLQNRPA